MDTEEILHDSRDTTPSVDFSLIQSTSDLLQQALNEMEATPLVPLTPSPEETEVESVEESLVEEEEVVETEEIVEEELEITEDASASLNLPLNSPTLSINETTSRFNSALWATKISQQHVVLAGVGGIGSYVAFLLARLNIRRLSLLDDDKVEMANLSGQFYSASDINKYKVTAMRSKLADYSSFYGVDAYSKRFTEEDSRSFANPIMICGFDNMLARRIYYSAWKRQLERLSVEQQKECLFIDGRLAAEEYQVFCIRGDDEYNKTRYERDFLFDDSEAEATVCSYKQTSFMANQIASTMVNLFVNHIANQCEPLFDRDVPFYTTYDGITMYFKTEN